jgi:hypothetical protein
MSLWNIVYWIVWVLGVFAFILSSEDYISKDPQMKKLLDDFKFKFIRIFNWRANANIREEIFILMRHFGWMSVFLGALVFATAMLHQEHVLNWLVFLFGLAVLAWRSFRWTFMHYEAVRPLIPKALCGLAVPWIVYTLDFFGDTSTLADSFQKYAFMSFAVDSNFIAALIWFGFLCAFIFIYYGIGWFLLSPFAYLMLGCLKLSRTLSIFILEKFKESVLRKVVVVVLLINIIIDHPKFPWS